MLFATSLLGLIATDGEALIRYPLHGQAQRASGILPANHWTYEGDLARYSLDAARAEKLLGAARFPRETSDIDFHVTLKTPGEERPRLIGAALQEQCRKAGVEVELRPLELADRESAKNPAVKCKKSSLTVSPTSPGGSLTWFPSTPRTRRPKSSPAN